MSDGLLDALHRLAEDMLDEPIPERLLEAIRKGEDADDVEADDERPAEKP